MRNIIDIPNESLIGSGMKVWNNGLAESYGHLVMSYRYEPHPGRWSTELGLATLDKKTFKVVENRKIRMTRTSSRVQTVDDARLINWQNRLNLVHAQGFLVPGGTWASCVAIAPINQNWSVGRLQIPDFGKNINASNKGKEMATEKNWSPFIFKDQLRLIYSINPLTIISWNGSMVRPIVKQERVDVPWWEWGTFFAGGTPLIRRGNEFIGICHTFTHDNPEKPTYRRYYGVPYAISAEEPHRLVRFGAEPLMYAEHDETQDLRPDTDSSWRPNVVYPMGLLDFNGKALISYGWQDCRCKLLEVTWNEIEGLLKPVGENAPVYVPPSAPKTIQTEEKPKLEEVKFEDPKLLSEFTRILTPMEGWCTPQKALCIAKHIKQEKPFLCVEIGVFGGRSLVAIAHAMRYFGIEGQCIGIDPWEKEASTEGNLNESDKKWWATSFSYEDIYQKCLRAIRDNHLQRRCSVLRLRSEEAFAIFGQGKIDLLHIDGNHSEEVSMRDAGLYMPLVKEGGLVIIDDLNWESTTRMQEFVKTHCDFVESNKMENGGEFAVFRKKALIREVILKPGTYYTDGKTFETDGVTPIKVEIAKDQIFYGIEEPKVFTATLTNPKEESESDEMDSLKASLKKRIEELKPAAKRRPGRPKKVKA